MKITNLILGALFLLFAIVQYNDPDPWLWMLLYGFIAGVLIFAAFGKREKWVGIGGFLICAVWFLTLLPDFINWVQMGMPTITGSMKTEEPHIEYTREFLGLGICMLILFLNWRKVESV